MQKQKQLKRLLKIAEIIRTECNTRPSVSFAEVAYESELAPSTLYGYIGMLCKQYPDIHYKDKEFFVQDFSIKSIDR